MYELCALTAMPWLVTPEHPTNKFIAQPIVGTQAPDQHGTPNLLAATPRIRIKPVAS